MFVNVKIKKQPGNCKFHIFYYNFTYSLLKFYKFIFLCTYRRMHEHHFSCGTSIHDCSAVRFLCLSVERPTLRSSNIFFERSVSKVYAFKSRCFLHSFHFVESLTCCFTNSALQSSGSSSSEDIHSNVKHALTRFLTGDFHLISDNANSRRVSSETINIFLVINQILNMFIYMQIYLRSDIF